jgi:hypothetical protein
MGMGVVFREIFLNSGAGISTSAQTEADEDELNISNSMSGTPDLNLEQAAYRPSSMLSFLLRRVHQAAGEKISDTRTNATASQTSRLPDHAYQAPQWCRLYEALLVLQLPNPHYNFDILISDLRQMQSKRIPIQAADSIRRCGSWRLH